MGLAERFKNKLENKNIFEKDIIEQKLEEKDIKFISKPVEIEEIETKNVSMLQPISLPEEKAVEHEKTSKKMLLEDLETELMEKIRRTPYWEDFSIERQTSMIEGYFTSRTKTSNECYSSRDKAEFVRTALALANNR